MSSAGRPTLEIVDDPVARGPAAAHAVNSTDHEPSGSEPPATAETPAAAPPALNEPVRYGREVRKAVFARVPRSISRRLERTLVELREETDDLTQEQLLAALLDRYVDPADPARLAELAATVERYRTRL